MTSVKDLFEHTRIIAYTREIATVFENANFTVVTGCVRDIKPIDGMKNTFVSPGNSLGFMDGGIDLAYMDIFPGIQERVKDKYKDIGCMTNISRPFFPVGAAVVVDSGKENIGFIAAPTMWLPQDVYTTENAYESTKAVLKLWQRVREPGEILWLPAMCCGYGGMSAEQSSDQMKRAFLNSGFAHSRYAYQSDYGVYSTENIEYIANNQPSMYMNREFRNVCYTQININLSNNNTQ